MEPFVQQLAPSDSRALPIRIGFMLMLLACIAVFLHRDINAVARYELDPASLDAVKALQDEKVTQ